jgi:hypothetical protein
MSFIGAAADGPDEKRPCRGRRSAEGAVTDRISSHGRAANSMTGSR